ncbi:hypothetical protein EV182_002208 [Spiromyces aspiralis]|uniref:Uncharacterized protein n=1 Tax=Spiromyces aspiralis TaxID=68401 RepID=A0ACC1HES4_9FUNG|nr:hypothetical protein EV182_002208 [Spiromyces aspiralis]
MNYKAEIECWKEYFVPITMNKGLRAVLASAGLWGKYVAFKRALGPRIRKLAGSLSSGQQASSECEGNKVRAPEPHGPALDWGVETMLRPVVHQLRQALEASPSSHGSSPRFPIRNEYSIGRAKKVHGESNQVGMALTREGMLANHWHNVLSAFEIKRINWDLTEHAEQYMLYAAEMWARQPRQFMLGGLVLRDQLYIVYGDRGRDLFITHVGKIIPERLGGVGGKGGSASLVEALSMLGFFMTLTERELGFIIEGGGPTSASCTLSMTQTPH